MLAMQQRAPGDRAELDAATDDRRRIDIVPFAAWHLQYVDVRPEQWAIVPRLTEDYGRALASAGGGFSAFDGAEVIAAAGIVTLWEGRAQVWALMTPGVQRRGMFISRAVKRYLKNYRCARVECVIDPTFLVSVEWATWLGFHYESTMLKYGVNGQTMEMYVRLE